MIFYYLYLRICQNAIGNYDEISYQPVISMDSDSIDTLSGYVAKNNISEKHVDETKK